MSLSNFAALLALASVLCTVASPVAEAANKRKSVIASRARYGLVPPPPAYMPTILPELYYKGIQTAAPTAVEKKEENPLTKYVYTRTGEEVKAISSRKGVSNWAPLRVKKPS
jgi:hypothetical protein